MREKIKQYWDERAAEFAEKPQATTDDIHLRELEIATFVQALQDIGVPPGATILDVGCGNGYSTLRIAREIRHARFFGFDYSEKMVIAARKLLEQETDARERVRFTVGDVTNIEGACGGEMFDCVLSDRCLINLESRESQAQAIGQVAKHLKPQGYYLAIENFLEGQEAMNRARQAVGLPEIPVRWHNLYFEERAFRGMAEPFFDDITFRDFSSSYYFATRVIYSALCTMRGEKIDYNHEIHQLAPRLPWTGQFSPIRLAILRRKSA